MDIRIYSPKGGADGLAAFCREMIEAYYSPAYGRKAVEMFLGIHSAAAIRQDSEAGRIWCVFNAGGGIAGTVTLADGELSRMFIAPALRGQGAGRLLAAKALAWAAEAGIRKLTAWSVPFSRGFYEKIGFSMMNADTMNFLGTREPPVPYIEMALRLGEPHAAAILPAAHGDAEELLAGQRAAFTEQCEIYDDWRIPPMTETPGQVVEFMLSGGTVLKAVEGGRIIGSVRGKVIDGFCDVGRLFVLPERQGKSVARRLMAALEETVRQCRAFSLYTGERSEKNLALYARQGYSPTGRRAPANKSGGGGDYDLVWLEKPNPWPEIKSCARRFRAP
jgi:GNAT superfamily N-acetyltransferase